MQQLKKLPMLLLFASSVVFAQSGEITINGIVPSEQSIIVDDAGTTLNPLGAGYANKNVGAITLNSNTAGGFNVSFSSANGGNIAQGPLASERIAYTIDLSGRTGDLGKGITEPNLQQINPDGGVLSFTGTGTGAALTAGVRYKVGVNTSVRNDLISGSGYTDTLTITISTL